MISQNTNNIGANTTSFTPLDPSPSPLPPQPPTTQGEVEGSELDRGESRAGWAGTRPEEPPTGDGDNSIVPVLSDPYQQGADHTDNGFIHQDKPFFRLAILSILHEC